MSRGGKPSYCALFNADFRTGTLRERIRLQTPEEALNPLFVEVMQKKTYTEYLLDILLSDSMEERASVATEYGKEVRKIE